MRYLSDTGLRTYSTHIKSHIQQQINNNIPPGIIWAYSGTTVPTGWLLCDGSAISRTTYSNLFSIIGTTYGNGNESTTFNLPNLIDKFIQGSSTIGTTKNAGLPNITGTAYLTTSAGGWNTVISANGAMSTQPEFIYNDEVSGGKDIQLTEANQYRSPIYFNASKSSSIYGSSTTVQPPALTLKYIIKY